MSESPDADKKRHKLGYQRISVACGHCRRRKIRCIMAEGDAQGRCQNCIRLQKQCVFYPVDQQQQQPTPSDRTGPSPSNASVTPIPSSSSTFRSSRGLASARSFEQAPFPHVTPVPSNAPPQGYHKPAYEASIQGPSSDYLYQQQQQQPQYPRQWTASNDLPHNTQGLLPSAAGGYPLTTAFPPYAGTRDASRSTSADVQSFPMSMSQSGQQWPSFPAQTNRAMSYGNFGGIQTSFVQTAPIYAHMQPQYLPQLDMRSVQMQQQQQQPIVGPQSAPPVVQMQYTSSQQQQPFNPGMTPTIPQQPEQSGWFSGQSYGTFDDGSPDDELARRTRS